MQWNSFAGAVALVLLVVVAIVLLATSLGSDPTGDNQAATYSFDPTGNLVPDKNGVIDAAFGRFLENPKFDPNAPVIIDQFYAVGLQHNHTDGYYSRSNSTVVVRRGFPFVLMRDPSDKVKFNLDEFKLYFYRRRNVNYAKFDRVDLEKDKLLAETQPKLYFNKYYGTGPILRDSTIQVIKRTADYIIFSTPVTAEVGQYQISGFPTAQNVDWDIDSNSSTTIMVNVIFNPYHPGDIVYNPDKALLNEYIHNEYGCNLQGDSSSKELFFWNYEQFDSDSLDASYKLLQFLSNFKDYDGSDPVSVIRGITFATNNEILNGLWLGVNKPQEITVKKDASDLDQRNLPDNFNRPFTVCNSLSDCKNAFTGYQINDKPVTDVLCTPSYNEPASIKSSIPRICSLNPKNPLAAPYFPLPSNKRYYKSCQKDDECADLGSWDGTDNAKNFGPIADKSGYYPVCEAQDICTVSAWNGGISPGRIPPSSKTILQSYLNGNPPTRWAECWIYASVLTTICRSLGLPCRQISAYEVARQYCAKLKDGNDQCVKGMGNFTGTISATLSDDGLPTYSNDVYMWSFHQWNNVWMRRPDLGETKYSAADWQFVDGTPQEQSFGVFQLGPAPLRAIQEKNMDVPKYDVKFAITEVNYDLLINKTTQPSNCTLFSVIPNVDYRSLRNLNAATDPKMLQTIMAEITGEFISTPKKLATAKRAVAMTRGQNLTLDIVAGGIAGPLEIKVSVTSLVAGRFSYEVNGFAISYAGLQVGPPVYNLRKTVDVASQHAGNMVFVHRLDASELPVNNTNYFRFTVSGVFPDAARLVAIKTLYLSMPSVELTTRTDHLGPMDETDLLISFRNPYSVRELTGASLSLTAAALNYAETVAIGNIGPGKTLSLSRKLRNVNTRSGSVLVVASLSTSEVSTPFLGNKFLFIDA
jgi:Transglutaminase-like superfamily